MEQRRIVQLALFTILIASFLTLSLFIAQQVAENAVAQEFVQDFGYFGILLLGIVGGFNLVVPVPAATFAPIFIAAGFSQLSIIIGLAIGTTIADLISYYVGAFGRHYAGIAHNPLYEKLHEMRDKHSKWVVPFIFLYATFSPYPNEVMVIPLAFLGVRLRTFILPILIGNTIYNALLVFGISSIFDLVF